MVRNTLGGYRTLNAYVRAKIRSMPRDGMTFLRLFEIMFTERENIMFESSRGSRVTRVTYGECYQSVLKKANTLRGALPDLPAGSVIGLHMENSREWIEMFWAILLSGFCPLLMNLRLDHENLEKALSAAEAKAVISAGTAFSVRTLNADGLAEAERPIENPRTGEMILMMSSGTSDHLKICGYTADAFRVMIEDSYQIVLHCPQIKKHYRGELKLLTVLPFYHVFGLVAVYVWFSFFSRTFVLLENMSPQTIVRTIRFHRVTHIFAVPLLWNRVFDQAMQTISERGEKTERRFRAGMRIAEKTGGIPLAGALVRRALFREVRKNLFGPSIRFLISGGSEIRTEVLSFFNGIGYHMANGYGMTEIGITSVELSRDPAVRNSGSVGAPFSSVSYRLGEGGILEVKNPGMACRIHDGTGWTDVGDAWFRTGDLAEERDGHWRILGRSDDMVISPTGENLNPNLVESALAVKGIQEICLIGLRTEDGVKPVLLAHPEKNAPGVRPDGLRQALTDRIRAAGLEGQISAVVFVKESLMEEGDIKLNRNRIARRYREGRLNLLRPDRDEASEDSALKEGIRALVAGTLGRPAEEIGDQMDFFLECGGSSLDYFSLAAALQEEYGVALPMSEKPVTTVQALAEYVKEKAETYE